MKTSKKMLSLLLVVAMLMSLLCMSVSASDYAEVTDGSTLELDAETYTVTSSAEHVYINGVAVNAASGYDLEVVAGQLYQIVTQDGTESPIVAVIGGK